MKIASDIVLATVPPPLFFIKNLSGNSILCTAQSDTIFSNSVYAGEQIHWNPGVPNAAANTSAIMAEWVIFDG